MDSLSRRQFKFKFNKEIPFSSFISDISFKRNIRCLFHSDSTPSARFYKDNERGLVLFCFTCRRQYTSYDYVKDVLGKNPLEYYKKITGKEIKIINKVEEDIKQITRKPRNFDELVSIIKEGL